MHKYVYHCELLKQFMFMSYCSITTFNTLTRKKRTLNPRHFMLNYNTLLYFYTFMYLHNPQPILRIKDASIFDPVTIAKFCLMIFLCRTNSCNRLNFALSTNLMRLCLSKLNNTTILNLSTTEIHKSSGLRWINAGLHYPSALACHVTWKPVSLAPTPGSHVILICSTVKVLVSVSILIRLLLMSWPFLLLHLP